LFPGLAAVVVEQIHRYLARRGKHEPFHQILSVPVRPDSKVCFRDSCLSASGLKYPMPSMKQSLKKGKQVDYSIF
jgi:hypothetical protein